MKSGFGRERENGRGAVGGRGPREELVGKGLWGVSSLVIVRGVLER